jgi:hypothetical protein
MPPRPSRRRGPAPVRQTPANQGLTGGFPGVVQRLLGAGFYLDAAAQTIGVSKLSSTRRMGGYGAPSRVMPNRLSSSSMLMVWTVTPPCRSFIRCRCSNRAPGGEHAKKNQQRDDFHFSSSFVPARTSAAIDLPACSSWASRSRRRVRAGMPH